MKKIPYEGLKVSILKNNTLYKTITFTRADEHLLMSSHLATPNNSAVIFIEDTPNDIEKLEYADINDLDEALLRMHNVILNETYGCFTGEGDKNSIIKLIVFTEGVNSYAPVFDFNENEFHHITDKYEFIPGLNSDGCFKQYLILEYQNYLNQSIVTPFLQTAKDDLNWDEYHTKRREEGQS